MVVRSASTRHPSALVEAVEAVALEAAAEAVVDMEAAAEATLAEEATAVNKVVAAMEANSRAAEVATAVVSQVFFPSLCLG